MNERQHWMQRLDDFIAYLRDELQREPTTWQQYESAVRRWIDFVLPLGHDPAEFNQLFVDNFLDQQGDLSVSSRHGYTSNLRGWCRWASGDASRGYQTAVGSELQSDAIAAWMARLEEYLGYLQHRGRKQSTIKNRRRHLSKWIRFACSTGREPAVWDPSAVEEAFVVWGTVESPRQRDYIGRRIQVWCQYWQGTDLNSPTLEDLVQRFRDSGYPDEDVPHHRATRAELELVLNALPSLSYEEREQLRVVWMPATYDYGGVGVVASMHAALRGVSEADWPGMRDQIHALCHGPGDLATRFDETVASVKGLGVLMATRMLAITSPNRFLPNFLLRSTNSKWPGKLDMIELLDRLDLVDASMTDEAHALLATSLGTDGVGELVVRSNDLLAEVLHPHFSEGQVADTWGMAQFLYWLAERYADDGDESVDDLDDDEAQPDSSRQQLAVALGEAAQDLLCGVEFLNDIVELLEDKGQVILYGPPGTGKTYLAQRLAQALVGSRSSTEAVDEDWMQRLDAYCSHLEQDQKVKSGTHRSIAKRWIEFALERELDPSAWDESLYTQFADLNPDWQEITRKTHRYDLLRWCSWASDGDDSRGGGTVALVQFHPAFSYEDFFEGFRPAVDDAGNMTYRLTPGPLVQIAEVARANPKQRYVMVIDEINRANLPRVLGELLFLLEYRDQSIRTQYRPVEQFSLPENLWFIGTMNTADRSIALIDAAMRRRFHFMPFFPNHGPMRGLLHRWMRQNSRNDEWIARLVDQVNYELIEQMGSDHALIGPSYFMKERLDESGLRRIWEYNIEPLIEDQFFGRREVIESFRFHEVWKRHGPGAATPASDMGMSDGSGEEAEPASDHDENPESHGDG